MLFQKRQDFVATRTGLVLGQTFTQELTREFHIEAVYIRLTAVCSANIATGTADGLQGLLKNVTVQVSDGSRTRNVVQTSGRALLELAREYVGTLDRDTEQSKDVTSTSGNTYTITYPIFFAHPQVSDPIGSLMLLPAPRFNSNPVITCTIASQADIDGSGTATFALTSLKADMVVVRRQVTIKGFPSIDTELVETTVAYGTSAANQTYDLQVPGYYTGILLRCYTSATARGDVSTAGGEFKLSLLGNVIRRFRLVDIQYENDYTQYPSVITTGVGSPYAGAYYLDFITDRVGQDANELGSLLNTNPLAGIGAKLQLIQDIAGGTNVQIKYLSSRIFGDLSQLQMAQKA